MKLPLAKGFRNWWQQPAFSEWSNRAWGHNAPWFEDFCQNFYDLTVIGEDIPSIVHFVPKDVNLFDPATATPDVLIRKSHAVEKLGIYEIAANTLARIQAVQNRDREARHPISEAPEAEKAKAISTYESLNSLIGRFLGQRLGRDLNGEATLFGFPLGKAPLSDGQRILLQFCVAVHAQADKLSELIVLMDEPENHLHPKAMLDAISAIEKALTNGQLWIATHSVPLLAHFDPDSIWWMHDGTIQHAGSQPEMVLRGLIGDDERIDRLGDFLGLPAALAANNFAHQCLLPPAVVTTGSDDPQTSQIARLLAQYRPGEKMRVLDFGAGRGRLVSALREGATDLEAAKARIDYRALDSSDKYRTECEAAIARLYGSADQRYFTEERDIRAQLDSESVDVVVMCNVLHEIDPLEWLKLFSKGGVIRHLLRPDGFLLVVEDLEMRVGEKAHQRGFLVLDTADLKRLFGILETDSGFKVDADRDGRLKAHLIPAAYLHRINAETLRKALEQVKQLAGEEIAKLRRQEASYRNGRRHALHVHQLANATLALEHLGAKPV